jgi:fructose 1,6-bisphosphatase
MDQTEGFKVEADDAYSVLVYADDLILLLETPEGMNNLLEVVGQFERYATISFNPKKSFHTILNGGIRNRYPIHSWENVSKP